MDQKIYTSKELNEIIGYVDLSGSNNTKTQVLTRCCNAGLKIKALDTPRGTPNKYIILEDNFHLDGEEWRICYCNDEWEVSNLGRIRRTTTKKLMGAIDTTGYVRITSLDKQTGKQTNKQVHRLVYFTFHPELIAVADTVQIDHLNGKRDDNRLDNLRALSNVENIGNRDNNQQRIKTLTTELVLKYGYEKTEKMLKNLLTNE